MFEYLGIVALLYKAFSSELRKLIFSGYMFVIEDEGVEYGRATIFNSAKEAVNALTFEVLNPCM